MIGFSYQSSSSSNEFRWDSNDSTTIWLLSIDSSTSLLLLNNGISCLVKCEITKLNILHMNFNPLMMIDNIAILNLLNILSFLFRPIVKWGWATLSIFDTRGLSLSHKVTMTIKHQWCHAYSSLCVFFGVRLLLGNIYITFK